LILAILWKDTKQGDGANVKVSGKTMRDPMRFLRNNSFRHVVYELKGGYLLLPVLITLLLSLAAICLPYLEESVPAFRQWAESTTFLVPSDPGMAQLLLGAIAGSCITIVSVVYSVILIALTFASIQFSPRILTSFVKDRVSQGTLGMFIGTFAYCLVLLPSLKGGEKAVMPTLSLTVALLLATVCVFYLIFFIHHIALAIQANYIVDRIARETEAILRTMFGPPLKGAPAIDPPLPEPPGGREVPSQRSGYIQFIDEAKLFKLAMRSDVTIYVNRSVGQFIPAGVPCITVMPSSRADEYLMQDCLDCFQIGPVRSMEGDIEFGVLQMVDIALKAISPAVNDPSTAISCIDNLSRILILAVRLEPPSSRIFDEQANLRLVRRQTSFPRLLAIAFDQIRPYGKSDMAVSLRLMRALYDISGVTNYPPYLTAIRANAQSIAKSCAAWFEKEDCEELFERLAVIEYRRRGVPDTTGTTEQTA
jgi:uncharacterized membrane protein